MHACARLSEKMFCFFLLLWLRDDFMQFRIFMRALFKQSYGKKQQEKKY